MACPWGGCGLDQTLQLPCACSALPRPRRLPRMTLGVAHMWQHPRQSFTARRPQALKGWCCIRVLTPSTLMHWNLSVIALEVDRRMLVSVKRERAAPIIIMLTGPSINLILVNSNQWLQSAKRGNGYNPHRRKKIRSLTPGSTATERTTYIHPKQYWTTVMEAAGAAAARATGASPHCHTSWNHYLFPSVRPTCISDPSSIGHYYCVLMIKSPRILHQ